jgi:hypothetical protein
MPHKVEAHRIFLTILSDSVLKLHRMMHAQFMRYHGVLETGCDESN